MDYLKVRLVIVFFACALPIGCAFTPQEAVLTTNVAVTKSSIGKNLPMALTVVDERPGKLAGNRGSGMGVGAEITLNDVRSPVRKEIEKGLTGHGFKPLAGTEQATRRLKVEVRVVELKFSTGFFTGGYFPRAALKAIADNGEKKFEKFYRSEKEERSMFVHSEEANNKLLSEVLSNTLAQIVNDQNLMEFLARQCNVRLGSKADIKLTRVETGVTTGGQQKSDTLPVAGNRILSSYTPHPFFLDLERPASPNHWLIAPQDFVVTPNEVSPIFNVPDRVLKSEIGRAVNELERVRQEHSDGELIQFVVETRLCHFKDDISIQVIAQNQDSSTLAAYSASRVGYWDLGKNRNRLRKMLNLVRSRLGEA